MKSLGQLISVREELKVAFCNLARAKSDEQYLASSTQFDQVKSREASLLRDLAEAKATSCATTVRVDVAAIVNGLERLLALSGDADQLKPAGEAIRPGKLFGTLTLSFSCLPTSRGKKTHTAQITGGVVTLGDASPPIEIHGGPTGRDRVKALSSDQSYLE